MATPSPMADGSCPTLTPPQQRREGTGRYLTPKTKQFLSDKLDVPSHRVNWERLAAEMLIFSNMEIENIKMVIQRQDSPTIELLTRYEMKNGGVDEAEFEQLLRNMHRLDIITELQESHVDERGIPYPLTEAPRKPSPSSSSSPSPTTSSAPSLDHSQPPPGVNPPGQPEGMPSIEHSVIHLSNARNVHLHIDNATFTNVGGATPAGNASPPSRAKTCTCRLGQNSTGGSGNDPATALSPPHVQPRQPSPNSHQLGRPKSDPISRKLHPSDDPDAPPRNMKESQSSPSVMLDKRVNRDGSEAAPVRVHNGKQVNSWAQEETRHVGGGDFRSLTSNLEVVRAGAEPSPRQPSVPLSPKERCFVISTRAQEDMKLMRKVCHALRKANKDVHTIHDDVPDEDKLYFFSKALFVVVIYTRVYEGEIKSQGSLNWRFYEKIKQEYNKNNNCNKRLVPVFEPSEISSMPNAYLKCDREVKDMVIGLLTNPSNKPYPQNNLSPSSYGSSQNEGSQGGGASPRGPHIVCEPHANVATKPPKEKFCFIWSWLRRRVLRQLRGQ